MIIVSEKYDKYTNDESEKLKSSDKNLKENREEKGPIKKLSVVYNPSPVLKSSGSQTFDEVLGSGYDKVTTAMMKDEEFEGSQLEEISEVEVLKSPLSEAGLYLKEEEQKKQEEEDSFEKRDVNLVKGLRNLGISSREYIKSIKDEVVAERKKAGEEVGEAKLDKKLKKLKSKIDSINARVKEDGTTTTDILKNYSLDEWICIINYVCKQVPPLVASIDLDIKKIAFNSGRYLSNGYSTIAQVDTILEFREQKKKLLNIYVLNKMFGGLIRNELEREVFLAVMVKSVDLSTKASQKLRLMYRTRRNLIRRFREFCVRRGYDKEWFYNHFASLPNIRYAAEHYMVSKRVAELELDKHEEDYESEDLLGFLENADIDGAGSYSKKEDERELKNSGSESIGNLFSGKLSFTGLEN